MKKQIVAALGMIAAALTFGSGCLVVTDNGGSSSNGCYQDCSDYEVCQTYCDAWDCWDECWYETSCDVTCPDTTTDVVTVQCIDDLDCVGGDICVSNTCVQPAQEAKNNAESGLCQACEDTNDCSEEDARCVRLNYQHSTKTGEKVCSRICELDDDCPIGFECVNISDEVGVPAQCLPKIDSDNGFRTCTNNAQLECVKAKECGVGQSCVNNHCVSPNGAECTSDAQCGAGEVCRGSSCVQESAGECVDRNDCQSGEVCVDAKCVAEKISCVFNSECGNNGKCVNGECAASCSANSECGPYERCRISEGGSTGLCEAIECRRTADCDAGSTCVDAQCKTSCNSNSECGDGFVCNSNHYCEEDPTIECRATSECSKDEICVSGKCQEACGCNQDCPAGLVCDLDSGACQQPASVDPTVTCATTCDCPSGQTCTAAGVCER